MTSNSTLSNTQAARQPWGPSFEAPVALARRAVALGDAKALRRNLEASLGGNGYDVSTAVDGLSGWNYETASELLEHGASTALRDNFGKMAQQMLELSKPVRRRPWSGSSAIPGGSRELSACRRGLPCTSRPRTATGISGGSAHAREAPSASSRGQKSVAAAETAAADRHLHHDRDQIDVGDSLSTLPPRSSVANAKEGSVSALTVVAGAGRDGAVTSGLATSPTECWRCHREMAILDADDRHNQRVAGSCTGAASTSPYDARGGLDHSSHYSSSGADNEAAGPRGDTTGGGVAYASRTGVAPRQDQLLRPPSPGAAETLLAEASGFGTLTTDGSPTSVGGGGGGGGGGDASHASRDRADVAGRPVSQAALQEEEEEEEEANQLLELSFLHVRRHNAGEGEESASDNLAAARERSSRGGGGGRRHGGGRDRISGRSPNQRSRRHAGKRGGRRRATTGAAGRRARKRNDRARGGDGAGRGASATGQQRRFFCPGDEVPEYVVGRRRMLWAQRSAEQYARRVSDLKRRREEIASPRRQKMAAAADREKRRAQRELESKERVRNSPLRWDRDGRPCSSPAALPAAQSSTEPSSPSSPARGHHQRRPSTAGPYGGRSCLKCDPRRWYRGEFMGGLGGLGTGSRPPPRRGGRQEDEGEGGRLWNRIVSDRYRLLRPWTTSPLDDSELWWAKPRLSGSGTAVVVKVLADGKRDATGWEAFIREWGVLKYLQEEGRVGGREPLSVGLVCAFETERSLVLSIPAGSRTLKEVGQQMHSERRSKKNSVSDGGVFNDQPDGSCSKLPLVG
ncbi:hypothetical protein Esi_0128_0039 [Ectocarpus siliculosus]|uniref:Uncharacterized protein n=2 Tax=Ectocarpus siliculosus TaxID=2880 RepID=D8LDY0_ECTSI|nr:hypothetical protein Esi_0128_0039 [Ectocarpus siliculosus]|eukprot:CBN75556.1 hypothetical protein Esi_0128_0039 [Ectocarpus siliculosus]